jgi:hypothetical protein
VSKQVVDRVETEFPETARNTGPHSPQRVERPRERLGAARCARSRPMCRPIRHGEAGRQPSHRAESREALGYCLRIVEPKKTDRARPRVGADDGAEHP